MVAVTLLCDECGEQIRIPAGATPRILRTGGITTPAAHVVRIGAMNVHRCELNQAEPRIDK